MKLDSIDVFAPPLLAILFYLLGWAATRAIFLGNPLPAHMKSSLMYGSWFILGMAYLLLWQDELGALFNWRGTWIALIAAWGLLLAFIALRRYRRSRSGSTPIEN